MDQLVLSCFPGIGLLDRAFEEEGFCVVRGPDLLWGGNIKTFHPPAGKFDGVIGGPPCQIFSILRHLNPLSGQKQGNLIPEFERVLTEAQPEWFLMENVSAAPLPVVQGYLIWDAEIDNRWVGGEQQRRRRFSFGTRDGRALAVDVVALEHPEHAVSVLAGHGPLGKGRGHSVRRPIEEAARLQGLPANFLADAPFTMAGKYQLIGNGVPLPTGRAIARAVKRALETEEGRN